MVRNIIKILTIASIALLTSCDRLVESSSLLTGNQQFRSGDYQKSIISYLKGIDSQESRDYFYYNLGNVYSYLGEYPSAFSIWSNTDGGESPQLRFNLLYNKGYLQYQLGNYKEAYLLFREALNVNPSSIHGKINLELSLSKMSAANYTQGNESFGEDSTERVQSDETTRILEYVKNKEEMTWGTTYQEEALENDW